MILAANVILASRYLANDETHAAGVASTDQIDTNNTLFHNLISDNFA